MDNLKAEIPTLEAEITALTNAKAEASKIQDSQKRLADAKQALSAAETKLTELQKAADTALQGYQNLLPK
jgi:chromosome segregation ATPase